MSLWLLYLMMIGAQTDMKTFAYGCISFWTKHGFLLQTWMQAMTLDKQAPPLLSLSKLAQAKRKTPYDWQLDVTEAILLGLDSTVVIAGTGSGKTVRRQSPSCFRSLLIWRKLPLLFCH
jgi:ATP-dependent helicase YprA (DUF1998 family)